MQFVLDVPAISVLIASLSVVGSAVYYLLETRHQRRMRQAEAIVQLSPWLHLEAKEIQEAVGKVCSVEYTDYQDYLEKFDGKPEQTALKLLGNYFEGIGMLVTMKLVDFDIVYNFWGDLASSIWDENEKIITGIRNNNGTPFSFRYWELLVKEIKKKNALQRKSIR